MRALYLTLVLLTIATSAFAQQEARSAKKGASDPLPITGTVVDADHNALDVYIKGGAAGGGGSGDASLAEQQTQTGILTTIDADTGNIATSTALIDDAIATTGSAITTKGMAASGTDGTNARVLKTDTNGELQIDVLTLPTLPAGTNAIGKLSANSGVDIGDVDVTSLVPGVTATSLGKAEDAVHADGDTGVMLLGVRNDSFATTLTNSNGDYSPVATDSTGRLYVNSVGTVAAVVAGTGATHIGKAEDAAHTTGDTLVGIATKRTDTAASSAGTDGDYATLNTDATGRVWANTEMPDAATLADDTSNPTVPGVASFNMCYDGTNWDRCTKATAGQGAVDTATQRVTIAQGATACPNYIAISQTADTTLVSGTSSQYFYICSIILVAGAAEVVSLWEGTGTACGTGSTAILGSTTEANGLSVSANGGFSAVSGIPFLRTATTANDICLRQSGTNRVSGVLTYYKAP